MTVFMKLFMFFFQVSVGAWWLAHDTTMGVVPVIHNQT